MPLRLRKSGQAGVPLLEILLLIAVLGGLAWFASNAMRKARQRAVLAILKPRGISGEFDEAGWLIGLDARGIPDDQFSLSEFRSLRDIPALNLNHTEATDESLADLPTGLGLRELSLAGTAIDDAGCQEITRHKALSRLDVRLTFVSDEGVRLLSTLNQLQILRLAQTWVTDNSLAFLKNLPRLAVLDLRDTAVTDDGLSTLTELPALKQLLLKNSDVTAAGVARLRSTRPDLEVEFSTEIDESVTLRLKEPNINPEILKAKPFFFSTSAEGALLRTLIDPPNSWSVEFLNGWASFVRVDARPEFNDSHFEILTRFRQLERLSLARPSGSVATVDVGHLPRNRMLRQLSLLGASVTDECLDSVARLPRLTHLWLEGGSISEKGLQTLREARRLSWLGLNQTSLTPAAIRQLKSLELRSLEIRDAGIGEAELQAIGQLDKLKQLDVSRNAFLGPGLHFLSNLTSLKRLDLSQTAVTDEDALKLLGFSDTLRDVVLTRSRVSPGVVAKLRDSGREWEITMVIPKIEKD